MSTPPCKLLHGAEGVPRTCSSRMVPYSTNHPPRQGVAESLARALEVLRVPREVNRFAPPTYPVVVTPRYLVVLRRTRIPLVGAGKLLDPVALRTRAGVP